MKLLSKLDKNPSDLRINIGSLSQYRSPAGGFINLIYILIAISIFALKLASILQGKNVHFNEQIVK